MFSLTALLLVPIPPDYSFRCLNQNLFLFGYKKVSLLHLSLFDTFFLTFPHLHKTSVGADYQFSLGILSLDFSFFRKFPLFLQFGMFYLFSFNHLDFY